MEEKYQNVKTKGLYPELSETELKEAEENLERYLELVLEIYERIRNNPEDLETLRNLTRKK